jgi:hypothetical protein
MVISVAKLLACKGGTLRAPDRLIHDVEDGREKLRILI